MPDNQVEIVFRTTAELQGALAAQAELEKTRGKLLALGESTEEVDAKLARANEVIAQAPAALRPEVLEQESAGLGKLSVHGHELRRVLSELRRESPLAGEALSLAFHPVAAALGIAFLAVQKFREGLKDMEEEAKTPDLAALGNRLLLTREAFLAGQVSAAEFGKSLEDIAGKTQTATESTNDFIESLRYQRQLQAELEDKQKALALAELDVAEQRARAEGTYDPVTFLQKRLDVERSFRERRRREQEQGFADELKAHQDEQRALAEQIPQKQEQLEQKRAALGRIEPDTVTKDRIEADKKNLAEFEKAYKESLDRLDEVQSKFVPGGQREGFGFGTTQGDVDAARAEMETKQRLFESAKHLLEQDQQR